MILADALSIADIVVKSLFLALGFWLTLLAYRWKTNKERMELIEKSFLDMQRFNECVLGDADNLKAAVLAVNPDAAERYSDHEARVCYVSLMRINRMYRAWLYCDKKLISEGDRDAIVIAHARTLVMLHKDSPDTMLALFQRGYPELFQSYLLPIVKQLPPADPLF